MKVKRVLTGTPEFGPGEGEKKGRKDGGRKELDRDRKGEVSSRRGRQWRSSRQNCKGLMAQGR